MWGRGIKISVCTYYEFIQFIHLFIHISMLMICANNNGVLKAPLFPMTLFIQAFAMRHALQSSTFEKKRFINLVSIKFNKSSMRFFFLNPVSLISIPINHPCVFYHVTMYHLPAYLADTCPLWKKTVSEVFHQTVDNKTISTGRFSTCGKDH